MSFQTDKVRAEYRDGSWYFCDQGGDIQFDQALVDIVEVGNGYVVGSVKSVHGIDMAESDRLHIWSKRALGVGSLPNLTWPRSTTNRVRLMPDGAVERIGGGRWT